MILRGFPVTHGYKVPSPGIVTEQRQRAPFAEAADNQERRSRRRTIAARGNESFAAHATHLVQSGQCRQLAPSLFIALRLGQQSRDWVDFASRRQSCAHGGLRLIVSLAVQ